MDDITESCMLKREIRNLLLMFGDDISYWTGEAVKVDGDKRRDTFYGRETQRYTAGWCLFVEDILADVRR